MVRLLDRHTWIDFLIVSTSAAAEIDNLKLEAMAFRQVRRDIGQDDGPQKVFDKVCPRLIGLL